MSGGYLTAHFRLGVFDYLPIVRAVSQNKSTKEHQQPRSIARVAVHIAVCGMVWLSSLALSPTVKAVNWDEQEKQFAEKVVPLLQQTCLDCHSGAEASAGLALDHFSTAKSLTKERGTFAKVIARLEIGDMPPEGAEPLKDTDRVALVKWLDNLIHDVDCGKTPNPGSVTLRRLTRVEYRNTVRDLLGVDYEKAMDFPGDDVGYGFDNIGDVLNLPPLLMEKYITAAEEISSQAIKLPEPGPSISNIYPLERFKLEQGGQVTGSEISMWSNTSIEFEESAPWAGTYHLEIIAGGTKYRNIGPEMAIALDDRVVARKVVTAGNGKDDTFDIPLRMKAGKHKIAIGFINDETGKGADGSDEDRNLSLFSIRFYGAKPQAALDPALLPESHRRIVTATPNAVVSNEQALQKVISPLMVYFYRRPVAKNESDRIVKLALTAIEDGESFEGSIQLAIQAMLLSPHFIFKVEQPLVKKGEDFPLLTEFELASRISYFIWGTMPDRELFTLAWQKQLRRPEVLSKQIDRMLKDPRAALFIENFAGQWLTLRKLENFEPNKNLFPTWNDEVSDLARQETLLFVSDVFRGDGNILDLLDADYTYLNDRLAKFYGVPGIKGSKFQKVSIKSQPRRGLLTQAAILAVTSSPTRTSPVKRGRFVLDNILNKPPPPPPPGVPELEKAQLTGSLREQIEQHRADPACAGCHKLMDPLGLAMENFDAVGLWRTSDRGQPIDASGVLPSGDSVRHAGDLIKTLRSKHADDFARCLTEKLMTYALGRGLEYYDKCAVDRIVSDLKQDNYRFSVLLLGIIESDAFQRKGYREQE